MNTRIAPSPTGDMHLGTARTAYFNWLAARASGGRFLLRIDDTDLVRSNQSKADDILLIMSWLKLDYDGLVYQSQRIDRYHQHANRLIEMGVAVKDDCIRLNLQDTSNFPAFWVDDLAGQISISDEDWNYIRTMPLIKRDDYPTYNFASVVDDIDLGIDFVIRGVDHITNTAKQAALYSLFNQALPKYAHIGLLTQSKKKLSKRDGAASMLTYKEKGYHPEAILNFMLRLGWGPTVDDKSTTLLPRDRALELFLNGGKMRSSPANIDLVKLDSFDRKYKSLDRKN